MIAIFLTVPHAVDVIGGLGENADRYLAVCGECGQLTPEPVHARDAYAVVASHQEAHA